MKFILNGCDISFIAEAPDDITLKQLLKQCDRIKPVYCACGIGSCNDNEKTWEPEIIIDYNDVRKADKDALCEILESNDICVGDECLAYTGNEEDGSLRCLGKVIVTRIPEEKSILYNVICLESEDPIFQVGLASIVSRENLEKTGRHIEYYMSYEKRSS